MREHALNSKDTFIKGWYLEDSNICDEIIKHHEDNPDKWIGSTGTTRKIDTQIKDSIDSLFYSDVMQAKYYTHLNTVMQAYLKKYPVCGMYSSFSTVENPNIQHYRPNGGYFEWHSERIGASFPACARHLVFMTYLNDVTDGGETEFYHQKIKVSPEKGLTLIWPADWTHTHKGITSPTQHKYIVTGWFSFTN